MTPNDSAQSLTVATADNRRYERDDIHKASFWVSQLFILAATVVGVYLASSQGFRQALAYGDVQSDKANFYLRTSLRNELSDNLQLVRDYSSRLETGGLPARQAPFALDTFVWENMKFSSQTLETPSDLLRESRQFYRGVADLQQKISSNATSVKVGREKLEELVKHMETTVLPKFDADIRELQASLAKRGVTVGR